MPTELLLQKNKTSEHISVPFLFFHANGVVLCLLHSCWGNTRGCGGRREEGWGFGLAFALASLQETPREVGDVALAHWVLLCCLSHCDKFTRQGKSVQCKFSNEVIQNQRSLKDVLLLCWNPVMIRFHPGYWNNWAVGVSLEWVCLTGTVWGVIKGRADKGDGSQVTLVEICLH